MNVDRRRFLRGVAGVGGGLMAAAGGWAEVTGWAGFAVGAGEELEPWRRGWVEIHHVSTGRGNCVLVIGPDGTSLMVDAGAKAGAGEDVAVERPDGSRRPGEWIGRYAKRVLRTTPCAGREVDAFLLTHLHDDHMGTCTEASPMAGDGRYRLTGVSDVAEVVGLGKIVDRGWPEYRYPVASVEPSAVNYIAFVRSMAKRGVKVEKVRVGSREQFRLRHEPEAFEDFAVRNLVANGEVWTGVGEGTRQTFPKLEVLKRVAYPTENMCSAAVRVEYGKFAYYNGGDLTCDTQFGTEPWMDVESAVAKVAGPVSVAALNHHGYFDADGPEFVRAMRARVWVEQSWHASHPALATLDRLYSPVLYAGERDVVATSLVAASELANARLSDKMLSQQGHVVVRVRPGGGSYEVVVVDDAVEVGRVKARFGWFAS